MNKPRFFGLQLRLLASYLLTIGIVLTGADMIAHTYKIRLFAGELEAMRHNLDQDNSFDTFHDPLIQAFHRTNRKGSLVTIGLGFISITGLSCLMAYYINRPVREIEQAVHDFAAGNLNARVPPSSIPEIHSLGVSINNMAASLQSIESQRRDMMGDLAHEMGTPLTVIEGYLQMLQDDIVELTPDILGQMLDEAHRLHRLRDDVLELSKVESGHLRLVLEKFNPKPILRGVTASFSSIDTIKQACQIRLECPRHLPDVVADRDRFKQVLVNLVSNAINYTPSGTVTIKAWSQSKKLWVEVIDTGIGISAEHLPHVFKRFWRADSSRQLATGGSGIGLALTKGLVERQGGHIEVESELGKGSTFRFSLPAFDSSTSQNMGPTCEIGASRNTARPMMSFRGTNPQK